MAKDRIERDELASKLIETGEQRRGPVAGDGGVADRLRDGGRSDGQGGRRGA